VYRNSDDVGLGFSLKPPTWLTTIVNAAARGTTAVQQAATQTQRVLTATGQASAQPAGDPAISTPTSLPLHDNPDEGGVPPWVLPVGFGLLGVLLLMRQRQRRS
jgi:hypothetical protein